MRTIDPGGGARLVLEPQDLETRGPEYAAIAKGSIAPWRLGPATAMALEDSIQREGWPAGAVCESEKTMAEHFGVGVRLMRQAFRILQARGAGRPQRGRNGGLVVLRPDLDAAAAALSDNLRWSGVTPEEVREAREVLAPSQAGGAIDPGRALALAGFERFLATVAGPSEALRMQLQLPETIRDNRASHMAWIIGQGITHERCRNGDRLGSLWDLTEKHGVSLAVAIDAIRILEDAGVVVCVKGRSGGVNLRLPQSEAVIALMHGYLAAAGAAEEQCVVVCHQLNIRAARKVAESRSPELIALIEDIHRRMACAQGDSVMTTWYALQKTLHDHAGNRALHLITRCLAAYTVRSSAIDAQPLDPRFLDNMVQATGVMVAAIRAGDAAGAEQGQCLTRRVLDERSPAPRAAAA